MKPAKKHDYLVLTVKTNLVLTHLVIITHSTSVSLFACVQAPV